MLGFSFAFIVATIDRIEGWSSNVRFSHASLVGNRGIKRYMVCLWSSGNSQIYFSPRNVRPILLVINIAHPEATCA